MKPQKILIIEDDVQVRRFMASVLTKEGHIILEADNGKTALQTLSDTGDVALVISDIIMPDMEGLETIRMLKTKYPALPVIAISGGGKIEAGSYLELAQHMGANQTLEKPFTRRDLLDCINTILGSGG